MLSVEGWKCCLLASLLLSLRHPPRLRTAPCVSSIVTTGVAAAALLTAAAAAVSRTPCCASRGLGRLMISERIALNRRTALFLPLLCESPRFLPASPAYVRRVPTLVYTANGTPLRVPGTQNSQQHSRSSLITLLNSTGTLFVCISHVASMMLQWSPSSSNIIRYFVYMHTRTWCLVFNIPHKAGLSLARSTSQYHYVRYYR